MWQERIRLERGPKRLNSTGTLRDGDMALVISLIRQGDFVIS